MVASPGRTAGVHRRIWAIAAPAMVAGSSAPLVGLVDTWAIGNAAGISDLAAIGAGTTVFTYILWTFGFLRMGTTGLVAQAHGRGDMPDIAAHIARAVALGLAIGVCLILAQGLIADSAATALAVPASVRPSLDLYIQIRIWSAPLTLVTYALTGYFIAVERTRDTMVLQLVLNISNAAFNLVFVLAIGWGAAGVAAGTVLAEAITLAVAVWYLYRHHMARAVIAAAVSPSSWHMAALMRLLSVNGWLFVRTLVLLTVLASVTRQAAQIGPEALAASHVLSTYMMLISLGLDAFAYAAESLSGGAYGRGDRAGFRHWVWWTSLWAGVCALGYSVVFAVFEPAITGLITSHGGVRLAVGSAHYVLALIPIIAVACYQFDGIFIGATATKAMAVTMAAASGVYILSVGPLAETMGLKGLWLAVVIFNGARGALQALYYPCLIARLEGPAVDSPLKDSQPDLSVLGDDIPPKG